MLIGHSHIWNFLASSAANQRLSHAYLFSGPAGVGKKKVAMEFVKAIQCARQDFKNRSFAACGICNSCQLIEKGQHPDVIIFGTASRPEEEKADGEKELAEPFKSQEIKIEQIRRLQHQLSLTPFYNGKKIVLIDDAERMTTEAANCLLKTLEEPSSNSLLILISANTSVFLATIISRCQQIKFSLVKKALIENGLQISGFKDRGRNEQAAKFSCGRPGAAISLVSNAAIWTRKTKAAEEFEVLRKKDLVEKFKYAQKLSQNIFDAREVLGDWIIWLRDKILISSGVQNLALYPVRAQSNNETTNLPGLVRFLKKTIEAKDLLNDSSFNSRLILENLVIQL